LNRVAVALGSNIGDRAGHLNFGLERLRRLLADLQVSTFHDTEPIGVSPQPNFLNAVAAGRTTMAPRALLEALQEIEDAAGRVRPFAGAPRTLDLDLILYGARVIDEPGLRVPHPRFRERRFVLEPLTEVAADWVDPVTGLTMTALLARQK
jgi:2-amino-4-hydroxy-6-hydroxymethyldihydropteridine diphosphokinase